MAKKSEKEIETIKELTGNHFKKHFTMNFEDWKNILSRL